VTVSLDAITNNGNYNNLMDIKVDVIDLGVGQMAFDVYNNNSFASSLAEIYFDGDGTLLGLSSVVNGPGTMFSGGKATPKNLPAGNTINPSFETTAGFFASAKSPAPKNGINPGESIRLIFDLKTGKTCADVITDLGTGDLRIGIHVIALPDGSSEAVITPEPTTIALLGLGAITLLKRRRIA
ncbi:MAG: PEP-CTERM sorting domain-containing protein, partial [Candidatus Brocadiia bacterium]